MLQNTLKYDQSYSLDYNSALLPDLTHKSSDKHEGWLRAEREKTIFLPHPPIPFSSGKHF